ncbi:MAG: prepilin-type N-terminal cleavage/methylation domain-containing protein [Intestinibaculum porci]|uniref:prepilin-type N-terminal cleavage/methylation domain-containing protein n=1 Tax=Intestinibaculum porci TaxID=2487118 RepID=UPI003F0A6619
MKNQNGFTLVEVIVALALVTMITGILATSLAQTLRYFNDANVYKKESDAAFDTIQSDSTDIQYKTEYKLVSTDSDNKKNSVRVRVSSYIDKSSKNKLTYQSIDVKLGMVFNYTLKYSDKNNNTKTETLSELKDYGIQKFDDLPGTNYSALQKMSDEWGDWAFIGWSTSLKTYTASSTGRKYINGNPEAASASNNWQGLITIDNFKDFKNAVATGQIKNVNLYATYMFSYDVPNYSDDIDLLKATPNSIRISQDNKNLKKLAQYAASLIKEKGTSAIDNCLSGNYRSAIYGNGLEILHFREGGWPVEAYSSYYTYGGDLNDKWWNKSIYMQYGKEYETSSYYLNIPKIGNASGYTQGFKKNDGFFYEVFSNGIGFDLTKIGNPTSKTWRGINYGYNSLLFSDQMMDNNNQFKYSLFMKIDKDSKEITVWVNQVATNGISDSTGINPTYSATASYA